MSIEMRVVILKTVFVCSVCIIGGVLLYCFISFLSEGIAKLNRKRSEKRKAQEVSSSENTADLEQALYESYMAEHESRIARQISEEIEALKPYMDTAVLGDRFVRWLGDNVCRALAAVSEERARRAQLLWTMLSAGASVGGSVPDDTIPEDLKAVRMVAENIAGSIRGCILRRSENGPFGTLGDIPFECRTAFMKTGPWVKCAEGKPRTETEVAVLARNASGSTEMISPCIYIADGRTSAVLLGERFDVAWRAPGFYCQENGTLVAIKAKTDVLAWSPLEMNVPDLFKESRA